MDFRTVDCIFRAGDKCEKRNVYLNSETQDSPPYQQGVMEHLLNSARGPVAK